MDSRNRRNLGRINDELQDVQKIMMQNIDDFYKGENSFQVRSLSLEKTTFHAIQDYHLIFTAIDSCCD